MGNHSSSVNRRVQIRRTERFLDLFTKDRSYAKQWRYTNAPDAEGRAIQAVYWANKWAKEQGKGSAVASVVSKAAKMGDFLRNDMFDKYFMKIGAQDKTPATGYDSAHYLMAWYTAWGGGNWCILGMEDRMQPRTLRYQNPFQGWVSATQSDFCS